jgi:hypothetical protein
MMRFLHLIALWLLVICSRVSRAPLQSTETFSGSGLDNCVSPIEALDNEAGFSDPSSEHGYRFFWHLCFEEDKLCYEPDATVCVYQVCPGFQYTD